MGQILHLFLYGSQRADLTSFFSIEFLGVFLPAALLLFGITPRKWKRYTLLLCSLGFFWLISSGGVLYLLSGALTIYAAGLGMNALHARRNARVKEAEKTQRKAIKAAFQMRCRIVLWLAIANVLGMLLVLKYAGFFTENVNVLFGTAWAVPRFVMPIGISFYTMQAISYLMDVYREIIPGERNPLRLCLFLSFFPQIVEGPICRYSETAQKLWDVEPIRYENFLMGGQRILYGLMKKLVVADRLNAFVNYVFERHGELSGGIVAVGALCYTIQLYMDFSGSMDAVMGIAQMFGIAMPENFRRPFFSKTISDFWSRWHVTLGTFFKDYIFYPITMSKPMKNLTSSARKKIGNHFGPLLAGSIALFCVWLANGLWHGAGWNYIFFGMYHFALILLGNICAPYAKTLLKQCRISGESKAYAGFQILRTGVLVVIGELFFRADGLRAGMAMFTSLFSRPGFAGWDAAFLEAAAIDSKDFLIVGVTLAIVLMVSMWNERGICLREALNARPTWQRWCVFYALILYIVIFGAYGYGYTPVDPMYANF